MCISSFASTSPADITRVCDPLTSTGKVKAVSGVIFLFTAAALSAVGSLVAAAALVVGGIALVVLGLCDRQRSQTQAVIPLNDVLSNEGLMKARGFKFYNDGDVDLIEVEGVGHPFDRQFNFLTLFS